MIMNFQISYLGLNSGRDAEGMMKRGVPVLGFEPVPAHCEALRNAFLIAWPYWKQAYVRGGY